MKEIPLHEVLAWAEGWHKKSCFTCLNAFIWEPEELNSFNTKFDCKLGLCDPIQQDLEERGFLDNQGNKEFACAIANQCEAFSQDEHSEYDLKPDDFDFEII